MGLFEKIPHDRRLALGSVFLVVNAVTWVFLAENVINYNISKVSTNSFITDSIWTVHFAALAICLIAGVMLTKKIGRRQFFLFWTILGMVSPVVLLVLNYASVPVAILVSILFAASIGLGMPNCMDYFTQSTNNGNRGRYAGFILLTSALGLFALRLVGGGIELTAVTLIVWRSLGLFGAFAIKPLNENAEKKANASYKSIIQQRSFILYIIPWAMFSFVNYLSVPVQQSILSAATVTYLQIIENAVAGISAVAGGFLLDYVGRKQAAIVGFVLLGLSYGILGLYPTAMYSWYFYTVFDGITWGILTILFVIIIWGELNQSVHSDKFYALGILPFFFSQFLSNVLTISLGSPYAIFSFTAVFLFIAVFPLLYAPETLPEKVMKDRDLKSYVEKAMKKVQSEAEKSQKRTREKTDEDDVELQVNFEEKDEEYEKAKKLAEKYY